MAAWERRDFCRLDNCSWIVSGLVENASVKLHPYYDLWPTCLHLSTLSVDVPFSFSACSQNNAFLGQPLAELRGIADLVATATHIVRHPHCLTPLLNAGINQRSWASHSDHANACQAVAKLLQQQLARVVYILPSYSPKWQSSSSLVVGKDHMPWIWCSRRNIQIAFLSDFLAMEGEKRIETCEWNNMLEFNDTLRHAGNVIGTSAVELNDICLQ